MKLRDLFEAIGAQTDDSALLAYLPIDANTDSDIEVWYQWFHHCNPKLDRNEVIRAIKQHDYNTFCKWYEMFKDDLLIYFPDKASVYVDGVYLGTICVTYSPKTFSLINFEDHECG